MQQQQIRSLGTTNHYAGYNAYRVGDTKLDWYGAEPGQGTFGSTVATGSAMAWTSKTAGSPGYQPLNK